jgi:hypothetical protein
MHGSDTEPALSPLRVGVVVCLAVACVLSLVRLDDVLGLYDYRADRNASLAYRDRLYGEPFNIVGSQKVVEEAGLWMPDDATYRVVVGPDLKAPSGLTAVLAPAFLEFLLLPRTQTREASATWVFCYGCDRRELGGRYEVLSDGGNGITFGRVR